jgi:hypothetical protein
MPDTDDLVRRLAMWLRKRALPNSGVRYESRNSFTEEACTILHGADATFVAEHFHGAGAEAMANAIADSLLAKDAEIERLKRERDEARGIVRDIYWMALRYADGRMTYAVGMCNDAVRKGYDAGWLPMKSSGGDTITPDFARDGMSPEWKSRTALSETS